MINALLRYLVADKFLMMISRDLIPRQAFHSIRRNKINDEDRRPPAIFARQQSSRRQQ